MAEPAIKSQPVYEQLKWDPRASRHLLAAEGGGIDALMRLLQSKPEQAFSAFLAKAGDKEREISAATGNAASFFESRESLLKALAAELDAAKMGLRLYLAGTEGFLWEAARLGRGFGLAKDEMRLEQCGSLERRVYCVHCKAVTDGVKTNVYSCPKCRRQLFVRDHFSRELAAYMGFQVDAETPGVIPAIEEIYP
jgi:hypothetical protein